MQSARHLLAAARLSVSATSLAARHTIFPSPVCQRCGRVSAVPISSAPIRLFARKARPTVEANETDPPTQRRAKRTAKTSERSDAPQHGEASKGDSSSRDDLMRLLAQLPAADVPAAIAALNQRLATSRKAPAQAEVIQAEVEVEEEDEAEEEAEDEAEEEEDENEAEYAVLRARLAKEGSVVTEAGEEIISMEELEKQLKADGELDELEEEEGAEEEEELAAAEEDDEDDVIVEEDEAEQILEEEEQQPQRSTTSTASSRSSTANTFWIQERRDGTVTVTEWPFADDDDDDTDLSDSYDLNMPSSAAQQAGIVGQAIGGEKLRRDDVLQMREKDLHEHFTKGGGRGGQKVNKTSNCVHLHHLPTGTIVKCHATRSLAENRRIAREIMQGRLEELMLGPASKNAKRAAKIRKQKAKTRRRAAIKYGETDEAEESTAAVDGTEKVINQHSRNAGGEHK